jgi:hypothetical protein
MSRTIEPGWRAAARLVDLTGGLSHDAQIECPSLFNGDR